MNPFRDEIMRLSELLVEVPGIVVRLKEEKLTEKVHPDRWSKKEILGHMTDSALVNILRFVKTQYEPYAKIVYNQDHWTQCQNHQYNNSAHLLRLWESLNHQLLHILKNISEDASKLTCDVGDDHVMLRDLKQIAKSYVSHLEHHVDQIKQDMSQPV